MREISPTNITNYHVQYLDVETQHWHPESETYAGGDHLITALEKGWEIEKCVRAKHWYAALRFVTLYQFHMTRNDKTVVMPVVENPYVVRLIDEEGIELIEDENDKEEVA